MSLSLNVCRTSEEAPIIPLSPPASWVTTHARLCRAGGRVLDLACGTGRHARWLATQGFSVLAVDRNEAAIAGLQGISGIEACCLELEAEVWPLAGQRFDAIVVTNYLWRPRWPDLLAMLAPKGVLIYETFMQGNEAYGKPSRPEFLLASGELRTWVTEAGLSVIDFAEGFVDTPKPAMRQAICAQRA